VLTAPLSVAQRLNLRLHRLFLLLLFAVVILNGFAPMLDNVDLGWHVAQGRWMVGHLAIYRADAFNYPNLGRPVVDEYPLFQLALYVSTLVGWWGPCVLCALGYCLLLAIFVLTARPLDMPSSSRFALLLGMLLLYLQLAFPLRPHLVTYLGIAAFGSFLLRHREAGNWMRFWPLALVQVVWTNCHSGFVIGPVMVALFGMEIIVRRWHRSHLFPWTGVRTWAGALALVTLGCFVNPYGALRLEPAFYQEHLEAIRAYVGEMQPLNAGTTATYQHITLLAVAIIALAIFLRRGAVSFSFLFLALIFYVEALSVKKAWPIFGVFLPLVLLSSAAFARTTITRRKGLAWLGVAAHTVVAALLLMTVMTRLDGRSDASLKVLWQQWEEGRTELPVDATAWMKQHGISGRLFHRCEDGGWLQQQGLGPTYADTGFGKYDETFIRETGLVADRPALLSTFLGVYRPAFVVCDDFAFQWPAYLQQAGCRLVFYSPNSSVWVAPGVQSNLPTVIGGQIEAAFSDEIKRDGLPRDLLLEGRNLIALNSLGHAAFAVAQLRALPPELHHAGWYWEAARMICFDFPQAPADLRRQLRAEADTLGDLTTEFRAYDDEAEGRPDDARSLLGKIPVDQLSDREAILLLRIEMAQHAPEALALARHHRLFDLSDGEYWHDRAELEETDGSISAAARAWHEAVFYAPDMNSVPALAFTQRHPYAQLAAFILSDGMGPGHTHVPGP
jgi:hypothetical protein